MKKTTREQIENKVKALGYEIGCYSKKLDTTVPKKELDKILSALEEEYTDILVKIKGVLYKVCIATVDNEKDITMKTAISYYREFGEEHLEDDLLYKDISKIDYNKIKKQL